MILVIDNYDSFVHNLARYLERLGQATEVVRNDEVDVAAVRSMRPAAIVLSPGPCTPQEAGISLQVVAQLHREVPLLGVCLGHQTIAAALGGEIVRAPRPMHGRESLVLHEGSGLFAGLASPLQAGRYHSLLVDEASLPAELAVTARTPEGVVMALEHRQYPVFGVQFHPESILTPCGYAVLANFLHLSGLAVEADVPTIDDELAVPPPFAAPLRPSPPTF